MRKIILIITFFFVSTSIYTQSDDMKELIRLTKESFEEAGLSVLEEWPLEINRYTGIGTEEQTFNGGTKYSAVLIIDNCSDCYPDLYFRKDGVDNETVQETYHESGLTMVVGLFKFEYDTFGQIVGLIGREAWYDSYLIIFED